MIDFIDMADTKNQRAVEQRLKDALKYDRARVQMAKISRFGLMELSRQRLRPALSEGSHVTCPRCNGVGVIRDTESCALQVLRILQEEAMKEGTGAVHAQVPVDVATFLLNEKRNDITKLEARHRVPIVLIPTTAGTGAEVTPNAIVAVPEKELKVGIVNENMIADYVILDARMIKNLPRKIAAATGVDALAHCIECFTSNKANPFSDLYALEGLDLILNNIEKACDDPEAMTEKNRMQIAAYYGGLAITASGTTAVHALSYPLGGKYHIAHGVSNAILLAPVMRFNSEHPAVRERLAIAYDRCCHEEKTCTTVEEKTAWMIARLEHIVKHLDIPTSLKEFGVPAEDLEGLVEAGMQVQRLLVNNMRPVTADDARKLYQEVM